MLLGAHTSTGLGSNKKKCNMLDQAQETTLNILGPFKHLHPQKRGKIYEYVHYMEMLLVFLPCQCHPSTPTRPLLMAQYDSKKINKKKQTQNVYLWDIYNH